MMTDKVQSDVERQIHDLLCGGLSESERYEALTLISCNDAAQALLRKLIQEQELVRSAFGYDHLSTIIPKHQKKMQALFSSENSKRLEKGRWIEPMRWLARAASIAIIVTLIGLIYIENRRGVALQRQMARLTMEPSVKVTNEDISRYRQIWSQVAEGADTWVLVSNGNGEFGNIQGNSPSAGNSNVLLVQCRIVDLSGNCLYTADLLLPDQPMTRVELPDVGQVAGRWASLTVVRTGERAVASLLIRDDRNLPLGVTGQISIGNNDPNTELGSFRVNNQTVKVFTRIQRLSGFQT